MGVERAKPSARTLNRYAFFFTASKIFRTYCRRQATQNIIKIIPNGKACRLTGSAFWFIFDALDSALGKMKVYGHRGHIEMKDTAHKNHS